MKISVEKCELSKGDIKAIVGFEARLEELEYQAEKSVYDGNPIRQAIIEKIATRVADEYLAQNKMALIDSLSKDGIVKGIELKLIENFSLRENR